MDWRRCGMNFCYKKSLRESKNTDLMRHVYAAVGTRPFKWGDVIDFHSKNPGSPIIPKRPPLGLISDGLIVEREGGEPRKRGDKRAFPKQWMVSKECLEFLSHQTVAKEQVAYAG